MRLDIQLTVRVWNAALPKGASKIVLLAVCKHVNETSGLAFPSVTTLALQCGMSPRTVQGHLRTLQRLGILVPRLVRTGRSTYYAVNLGGLPSAFPADGEAYQHPVDNSEISAHLVDNSAVTTAESAPPATKIGTPPPQLSTLTPAESAPITGINFKENIQGTAAPALPASALMIDSVKPEVLAGFAAIRKAKRKGAVTAEVIEEVCQQAHLAGLTLEQALQVCIERKWARFEAGWMQQSKPGSSAGVTTPTPAAALWKPPVSTPATPAVRAAELQRQRLLRQSPPTAPALVAGIQIGTTGPAWAHGIVGKHLAGQHVSPASLRDACTVLKITPASLRAAPTN